MFFNFILNLKKGTEMDTWDPHVGYVFKVAYFIKKVMTKTNNPRFVEFSKIN